MVVFCVPLLFEIPDMILCNWEQDFFNDQKKPGKTRKYN